MELIDGINQHEGRKYLRTIADATDATKSAQVDVYAVLVAFEVACPARAHAVKKLLCAGGRGKGDELADLVGAKASVSRAIEIQTLITPPVKEAVKAERPKVLWMLAKIAGNLEMRWLTPVKTGKRLWRDDVDRCWYASDLFDPDESASDPEAVKLWREETK
jgi:hypothetical protein